MAAAPISPLRYTFQRRLPCRRNSRRACGVELGGDCEAGYADADVEFVAHGITFRIAARSIVTVTPFPPTGPLSVGRIYIAKEESDALVRNAGVRSTPDHIWFGKTNPVFSGRQVT